jgi:hypothetical protein
LIAFCCSNAAALAEPPRVSFDLASIAACRDVTSESFMRENPDERLLELKLEISAILHQGEDGDLTEFLYRFESRCPPLRVVDYSPKTSLATDIVGNVGVEKKKESSSSLGVNGNGGFQQYVKGSISGTAAIGSKSNALVRYDVLPPLDPLSTSGTLGRGTGVYFKLKASKRTALEGAKQFVAVLRAPANWRAGLLQIHCRAEGVHRGVLSSLDETFVCGVNRHMLAMYLEGDEQAKALAREYAEAERSLRQVAGGAERAIKRRRFPSVAHRVGAIFELVDPKFPEDWMQQMVFVEQASSSNGVSRHLPPQVREAAQRYLQAKLALTEMRQPWAAHFSLSDQEDPSS